MIRLIKSTFYNEADTKRRLIEFLADAQTLSMGAKCREYEEAFAAKIGHEDCVLVNSGSSANLALIQALMNLGRLKPGDRVGFSATTWATNVMPLITLGLRPVPVDIELDTLNVSSRTLNAVLDQQPLDALFITNLLGFCDDLDVIAARCKADGIVLIEDNCESLGTVYKGKQLGTYGVASTFSFYVGHHLSAIEGGAVCTSDPDLAMMLRMVRAHGWDRDLKPEEQEQLRRKHDIDGFYHRYTFYDIGYNLRPTEIQGVLGMIQLEYLDEMVVRRERNFERIASAMNACGKYHPLRWQHLDVCSNFTVPLIMKSVEDRDALIEKCEGKIETRPIVGGDMTLQPFYSKYVADNGGFHENAALAHRQGLYVGNNPEMTDDEIETIIRVATV